MRFWSPTVTPRWLASAVVVLTIMIGAFTLGLEEQGLLTPLFHVGTPPSGAQALNAALVVITIAVWFGETGGVRWPRPVFVAAAGAPVAGLLVRGNLLIAPLFLVLLVGWSAYVDRRRTSLLTLAVALVILVPPAAALKETPGDWIPWVMALGLVWTSCHALASQQRLLVALRAAQADLTNQAAAEERRRIAREVHDVIAHALAVTLLHITGARHILLRDPEQAAAALATAEQLGRQSLADIRRTVGLLAAEPSGGRDAPLPTATDIAQLVRSYTTAGQTVRLTVEGDPSRLSSAAGLGLYRIAQEALTNAAKHAPGAETAIRLTIEEWSAVLRVRNGEGRTGAPSIAIADGPSLGVAGMRERAMLLGGSLLAQPSGRGWLVECRIPVMTVPSDSAYDSADGTVLPDHRAAG
jgi:signal transduction histidine kinase